MNPKNQQFIKGAIITVIIAAAIGALTVLASDTLGRGVQEITGKLFLVSLSLIFFGITATIAMVVTEKPQYKVLGNAGMIVSALAFLLIVILIFAGVGNVRDLTIPKLAFSLFLASIALAHISLLHHFNLQNKYAHFARVTATIFISLFTLVIIVNVFGAGNGLQSLMNGQSTIKIIVVSLIIDLAATVLVPLCNRLKTDAPAERLTNTSEPPPVHGEQNPVQ